MKEEWKDIVGYEGLYQVSNLGRIKSLTTSKILKQHKVGKGYLGVTLSKNSIQKYYRVHRLVLENFKPIDDMHLKIDGVSVLNVDHINNIKTDNRLKNLQWLSLGKNLEKARVKKKFKKEKN